MDEMGMRRKVDDGAGVDAGGKPSVHEHRFFLDGAAGIDDEVVDGVKAFFQRGDEGFVEDFGFMTLGLAEAHFLAFFVEVQQEQLEILVLVDQLLHLLEISFLSGVEGPLLEPSLGIEAKGNRAVIDLDFLGDFAGFFRRELFDILGGFFFVFFRLFFRFFVGFFVCFLFGFFFGFGLFFLFGFFLGFFFRLFLGFGLFFLFGFGFLFFGLLFRFFFGRFFFGFLFLGFAGFFLFFGRFFFGFGLFQSFFRGFFRNGFFFGSLFGDGFFL